MIQVIDKRQAAPERGIPWQQAQPGCLYQTIGGQAPIIVMAVRFPAVGYDSAFPDNQGLAFVHADGRAYPCTTDRLLPLKYVNEWFITGEEA